MTAQQIIMLAIQISLALIVFALGLQSRIRDVTGLLAQPGLLARSLAAMYVIVPAIVIAVCASLDLDHSLEVALIVLALSPVPPFLPGREVKAGGDASYAVGLLVIAALVSLVFVPVGVYLVSHLFGRSGAVAPGIVAKVVVTSIFVPLAAGVVVRWLAPTLSAKVARPLTTFAMLLLVVACLPVLYASRHALAGLIGNFSIVAIIVLTILAVLVGHWLGGPQPDDRTVLGLSAAMRHPGMAMALAHTLAPDDKLIPAAVLLIVLVAFIATIPYAKRRARVHAQASNP
jgi:BASS family bile acid:Na+ symporter